MMRKKQMYLYDLLEQLDKVITPYTTKFSDYVKAMEENSDTGNPTWVVVAFKKKFQRDTLKTRRGGFRKNSIQIMYLFEDYEIPEVQEVLETQGFEDIRFYATNRLMTLLK